MLTGSTLLGLAMFATLFLGCVLAVFLTLGAVRGDAERGLLQPLVVRPLGRTALLGGRFAARGGRVRALRRRRLRRGDGDHRRRRRLVARRPVGPGVALIAGGDPDRGAVAARLGLPRRRPPTGSRCSWCSAPAWPPACWARSATRSTSQHARERGQVAAWALPFEALYQGGLDSLTAGVGGDRVIVQLGPFGGAQEAGALLWPWTIAYLVALAAAAPAGVRPARPLEPLTDA